MASRASSVRPPLSREAVQGLLSGAGSEQLAAVHFPIQGASAPDANLVWAGLVMIRENGFMLVIPSAEVAHRAVEALSPDGASEPMFFQGEVELINTRGRVVGRTEVELVDLPWELVGCFTAAVQFRGSAAQQFRVLGFQDRGNSGKPSPGSVSELANAWLDQMDQDTAQEYLTGVELDMEEEEPVQDLASRHQPTVDADVVSQLQARIAELESMLGNPAPSAVPMVPPMPAAPKLGGQAKSAGLFQSMGVKQVSPQDWAKLKSLAGSPPPRVASVEQRRPSIPRAIAQQETLFADMEKEATEEDLGASLDPLIAAASGQPMDPIQQILMAQLQQNQVLLQRLVGNRNQDPVLKALGGGGGADSVPGSSSGGVRGCLARDVFLKASTDLPAVALMVRNAALKELGISANREDSNLLRKYMERRIPLSDHRLLAQFATLVADGWSTGYTTSNPELLGVMGRFMIFIEQCALDAGRSQFAWLLTGLQDPPMHLLVTQKRKPGMEPFTRLCSPSWISANLAYVKDLDYMESRMNSMVSSKPGKAQIGDEDAQPKAKAKNRPKGKGRGKAQSGQEADQTEGS